MMILKLHSKYFPTFNNSTQTLDKDDKGHLSAVDLARVTAYLNNPEIILLLNNLLLLGEGTIPENDWAAVKYIPINPYFD